MNIGLRCSGNAADGIGGNRRVPPAQVCEPFLLYNAFNDSFADEPLRALYRKENHANAVLAGKRKRESKPGALAFKKCMRYLNQGAGAISGNGIASAGASVLQVDENLNPLGDDIVRLFALDVG